MQPESVSAFPTSFAQERLWIAEQLTPGTAAYHVPVAVRLTGPLDRVALARAIELVVARHEALRTVFTQTDGHTAQIVVPEMRVDIDFTEMPPDDPAALEAVLRAQATAPFDLTHGPLLRVGLVRLRDDEHVLAVTLHHLVSDMWSCGVLLDELGRAYGAFVAGTEPDLPALPIQYVDFAVWQRAEVAARRAELTRYWRDRLDGATPLLELPADRPRPAVQTFRGAQEPVRLAPDTTARIRRLGREHGATPFMVLLAALQAVLGRYAGTRDVVVSTGVGTRGAQTERLIGCFINIVLLRTSLDGRPSFAELVRRAREVTVDALAHQDLPFDKLVEELAPRRDLSYNPYSQVMLIVQNAPLAIPAMPQLSVSPVGTARGATQCDLNVQLREVDGTLDGFVEYSTDLFDVATIRRLWGHLETLLEAGIDAPDTTVDDLPMLTRDELARTVVAWNTTAADLPDRCLHELVEEQVVRRPDAVAVTGPEGPLTYRELNARAGAVARRLRALGVGPDALVGLCVRRGAAAVVGMLGILKAGGAYLPLDPEYPAERLSFMLTDARPVAVLTQASLRERVPDDLGVPVLSLDEEAPAVPDAEPARVRPHHLAYVIYTSGSTGRPKGVTVTHRGVVNNVTDLNRLAGVGPADRALALSPLSFDMSVYEVFGLLAAGGTVVLPEPERAKDPRHWLELLDRYAVTVWNTAPTLLESLVDAAADRPPTGTVRVAFLGGDWIPVSLPARARAVFPRLSFVSLGGATEASIHSVVFPVASTDPTWTSIPYGRPMANQQLLIVDEALRPVPVGVPGELCLGGVGLVRGYLDRPGLTATRFVPHPYAGAFATVAPGARLYRTGDLARYRPDGVVELLGRLDHQVKVRGHRVELGEIAAALGQHAAVAEAVAIVRRDADEASRLVAYYVPVCRPEPTTTELRTHLKRTLPDYMVPEVFVALDALPLSPNGKVDRGALPAVAGQRPVLDTELVVPRSPIEEVVADIWRGVLQLDTVGVHDDFFDLGGQSLLATQVAALLRESFRVEVPLRAVFEAPTVAAQAELVSDAGRAGGVDVDTIAEIFLQVSRISDEEARAMLDDPAEVTS
jgi:amino acid adenylation domain-containing protein